MNQDSLWMTQSADIVGLGGKDCLDFIHRMSSGNLRSLTAGGAHTQTLFVNAQGKLLDWCTALRTGENLTLWTSAGRAAVLWQWLERFIIMDDVTQIAPAGPMQVTRIFGPRRFAVAGLAEAPPAGHFTATHFGMAFTGLEALGPHLVVLGETEALAPLQARCTEQMGAAMDATAFEVLRLRAGVPQASHEFPEPCNPFELRLGRHAIAWNKGCYIGQEVLSRLDSYDKVARLMMGFETQARFVATPRSRVVDAQGAVFGKLTSCIQVPTQTLGLCIVKRAAAQPQAAFLQDEAVRVPVQLIERPFF